MNDMLRSLGPDMLSLLDDQHDYEKHDDPSLKLSDILFPQPSLSSSSDVGTKGELGLRREQEEEESGFGSLSSFSPTSLISPGSDMGMIQFSDSDTGLDPSILLDSDGFWDVLVSSKCFESLKLIPHLVCIFISVPSKRICFPFPAQLSKNSLIVRKLRRSASFSS